MRQVDFPKEFGPRHEEGKAQFMIFCKNTHPKGTRTEVIFEGQMDKKISCGSNLNQGFESHRKQISSNQNWGLMLKSLRSSPGEQDFFGPAGVMSEHLWIHKVTGGLGDLYRFWETAKVSHESSVDSGALISFSRAMGW